MLLQVIIIILAVNRLIYAMPYFGHKNSPGVIRAVKNVMTIEKIRCGISASRTRGPQFRKLLLYPTEQSCLNIHRLYCTLSICTLSVYRFCTGDFGPYLRPTANKSPPPGGSRSGGYRGLYGSDQNNQAANTAIPKFVEMVNVPKIASCRQ